MGIIYKKNTDLIDKKTTEGLLLFNVESGSMVELNSSGKVLWENTNDTFEEKDLKDIFKEQYSESENLNKDIADFLESAKAQDIIIEEK